MTFAVRLVLPVLFAVLAASPAARAQQIPAPERAAYGTAGESYAVHDHGPEGRNWHVEVQLDRERRLVAETIVAYVQECAATAFVNRFRVDLKGRIQFGDREFDLPKKAGKGSWSVHAIFTSSHVLKGTFRIKTPTCDSGDRPFEAHTGDHEHGSKHRHGTRPGKYPDLTKATPEQEAEVRGLWRDTLDAADELFPTYRDALSRRFRRYELRWKRPLLFHLRNYGYAADKHILKADRPESLVYWWPKVGEPILLGFMYRAPLGRPPAFGGELFAWHSHIEGERRGDNQMTHIWLTNDLRSALANCLPVQALETAHPEFTYSKPAHGAGHESRRCRDTP